MNQEHKSTQQTKIGQPAKRAKEGRVVIIDDHPLVRDGLAGLLSGRGYAIVAAAATAGEGLDAIRHESPDLVVMDLSLLKASGLELIKQIKTEMPTVPVLVISMHDECVYAERVLRAGARGYVMKKEPSEKIFAAIAHVLRGDIYVSDTVKQQMLAFTATGKRHSDAFAVALDHLSDREMQVFQLLGNGIPTREIAEQLHLSVKTIETYRENLKAKLNLPDGAALVQRAIQWGKANFATA